jgi:hypothetical protein
MAQPGYEVESTQEHGAKISGQRARQGQNIKGMLAVLVVGVLLVSIAYGIMLALRAEPSSVVNESRNEAATSATTGEFPTTSQPNALPDPARQQNPETAGSPS